MTSSRFSKTLTKTFGSRTYFVRSVMSNDEHTGDEIRVYELMLQTITPNGTQNGLFDCNPLPYPPYKTRAKAARQFKKVIEVAKLNYESGSFK